MDLPIQSRLVGDIHRNIHRIGAIEALVGELHPQCVTLVEGDPVIEPGGSGQQARHLTEFRGQVDPGDPATKAACEVAGGAADPTADIQNMILCGDREEIRELLRCLDAPAVEVIERPETLNCRTIRIDILGCERGPQSFHESAAAVMRGNVVDCRHSTLMIVRRNLWIDQWSPCSSLDHLSAGAPDKYSRTFASSWRGL